MNGIRKVGLGLAAAAGAYVVSQYVGDDESAEKEHVKDTAPPEPATPPAPEVAPPAPDVDEARERARTETAEACSTGDKAKIEAAKELVAGLTGESLSTTYECTSEAPKVYGQPVLGLVVSRPGEAPVAKLTSRAFETWVTPEQRGAAVLALNECATTGACDTYTGPGSRFTPGGEIGDDAQEFIDAARSAKKTATAEAAKPAEEFTEATMVDAVGKGIYQDTRGGILEGNFNHGEVNGTYTLHGAKLTGSFTVEDGLVKPKGAITVMLADGGKLRCTFIDGHPDGRTEAFYTPRGESEKKLHVFNNASVGETDWHIVLRQDDEKWDLDQYHLTEDFKITITPKANKKPRK